MTIPSTPLRPGREGQRERGRRRAATRRERERVQRIVAKATLAASPVGRLVRSVPRDPAGPHSTGLTDNERRGLHMAGAIQVTPEQLQSISGQLNSGSSEVESILSQLAAVVSPLQGEWVGQA